MLYACKSEKIIICPLQVNKAQQNKTRLEKNGAKIQRDNFHSNIFRINLKTFIKICILFHFVIVALVKNIFLLASVCVYVCNY